MTIKSVHVVYFIYEIVPGPVYRIARRHAGGILPAHDQGTELPGSSPNFSEGGKRWTFTAPPQHDMNNNAYVCGFWWVTKTGPNGVSKDVHSGDKLDLYDDDTVTIDARAYFFWKAPPGPGEEAIYIDAFDTDNLAFLPDDFVTATPDHDGTLTIAANNGYIDSSTLSVNLDPRGTDQGVTIGAFSGLRGGWKLLPGWMPSRTSPTLVFDSWQPIDSLIHAANANNPPDVGMGSPPDIIAHKGDDVFAVAFYHNVPPRDLGGVPIAGQPPYFMDPEIASIYGTWVREFSAALTLANAATVVSPQLKADVLELALKQVQITAETIKKQIEGLRSSGD